MISISPRAPAARSLVATATDRGFLKGEGRREEARGERKDCDFRCDRYKKDVLCSPLL